MKIAFVTDDGITISQHFGRARFYEVLTVEDGKIVSRERREKMGHAHFAGSHDEQQGGQHGTQAGERHGFGAEAEDRHAKMAAAIHDCQYLVVGGMGAGAYESMKQVGVRPLVTDMTAIDDALKAQLAGTLKDHTEYLH